MRTIFFDGWFPLVRTAVIAVLAYVALVFFLRISGKRTLSKMNAFDFIVTVALGSTLAAVLVDQDVALAQGALALGALVGLQYLITSSSIRLPWVRRFVTGEPTLVLYRGELLDDALRKTRVTRQEIQAAIRGAGVARIEDVEAIVLETNGSFSVVPGDAAGREATSIVGVETPD